MIIDHEKSTAAGEAVPMDGTGNDETMALRVVTPEEVAGPAPSVDYAALEAKVLDAEGNTKTVPTIAGWGRIKRTEAWMAMRKGFTYRHVPGVTGRTPRVPFAGWSGPFPVRRADNMHGDPAPLDPEFLKAAQDFAKEAPIEDVVEAVKELSTEPVSVVRSRPTLAEIREFMMDEDDEKGPDEDTGTYALPAVWKMTGKPSTQRLAHRSAAHVQRVFNEAGWPIAVWYGEATKEYWVMDESGLHSFDTITAMYQGMGWEAL